MASLKAVLRPKKNKAGEQLIYIRITHKGKTNYKSIGTSIKAKFWNAEKGLVRPNDYYEADLINKLIDDRIKEARDELYAIKVDGKVVTASKIKSALTGEPEIDFISFADKFVQRKFHVNIRTGKRYQSIVSKIKEYTGGTLPFGDLNIAWIKDYSDWLVVKKKNGHSTIHSNLRGIRAIINDAIKEDLIALEKNPFLKMRMERPKPQKTKLNLDEINALKAVSKFTSDLQRVSRDAFLFSFFTCGMRFSDLCLLTWDNIEGNSVKYFVSKTKENLSVELGSDAKTILQKYKRESHVKSGIDNDLTINNGKPRVLDEIYVTDESGKLSGKEAENDNRQVKELIFPILKDSDLNLSPKKLISRIDSANAKVNSALKLVAGKAGITKTLSFHVARHSYANIANNYGMPLSAIQSTLNHKSSKTTEIYLNSLENEVVNKNVRDFFKAIGNG